MYFIIGIIVFNLLIFALNLAFVLIGETPWNKGDQFAPLKVGKKTYTVERFSVGISISALGLSWLVAWFYFLITGWNSFIAQIGTLFFHVFFQLIAGIAMLTAGIGIFKQWKKSNTIFLTSILLFTGSTFFSLVMYGAQGHGNVIFMYLLSAFTIAIAVIYTSATYLLDRLIHKYDENLPEDEKLSA